MMSMKELLRETATMLVGRTTGPLTLRLILQPTVAALLAIRAGLTDARTAKGPYFWSILFHPSGRDELLRSGWKDVRKVFFLAVVLDVVYEVIVFRWVYPVQALIVAAVLAIVPYVAIRGLTTRIAGVVMTRRKDI
jgi:hypothetical protein